MKVNEIFYSLQGEGFLTGAPSVFIRLAGCPLRCKWCDTKYAWDYNSGRDCRISEITNEVQKYDCKYAIITGGEPMVTADLKCRKELPGLARSLKDLNRHITIETAGLWFEPDLPCDLMSISPKLSNSGLQNSYDAAVVRRLIDKYDYQLKFVVDSEGDIDEILQVIERIGNVKREKVLLMPQAVTRDQLLAKAPMVADLCKQTGFTFGNRLQVFLWDSEKGT